MAPTADAGPDLGGVLVTRSLSGTPAVLADVLTAAAEAAPDSAEELLAADASEDMTSAFDAAVGALQGAGVCGRGPSSGTRLHGPSLGTA